MGFLTGVCCKQVTIIGGAKKRPKRRARANFVI